MTHVLQGPEFNPERFTTFVESHADIVLDTDLSENVDVARESSWNITAPSELVPVDEVKFQVRYDLGPDHTVYHEIELLLGKVGVLWVGYDEDASTFSSAVGDGRVETSLSHEQIGSLIDRLEFLGKSGNLIKVQPSK